MFFKSIPKFANEFMPIQFKNSEGEIEEIEATLSADYYDQAYELPKNQQDYLIEAN